MAKKSNCDDGQHKSDDDYNSLGSAHDFIPGTRLWRSSKLANERTKGGRCVAQDGAWLERIGEAAAAV